ncbi:MAG: type II secretion system F family protein [Thermodesulfovibrionales bacterium]|nr:type II secretion system F family protein [Thermodesulfovibrionales bacterium]
MPLYTYEAAEKTGKKVTDTIECASEAEVKERLSELGLMPLAIKTVEARRGPTFSRVSSKDLMTFTSELANLIESGLPLDRALYVLSVHSEKAVMREVLTEVYKDLQRGQSLSNALSHQKAFPKIYVNMVRAGEAGGILEEVLHRLAGFLETTVAFKEELISALVYPAVLTGVGGSSVAVILIFVLPRFAEMFDSLGQEMPAPTRMLMGLNSLLTSYWWLVLIVMAIAVLLGRSYLVTSEGRQFMDNLKLRIPIVRGLHKKAMIARFSRTLGTLLKSGVPILEAIMVSREVVGNEVVANRLIVLEEGVRKGLGVAGPLRESGVFPSIVVEMIAVGEEAGRLDQTFISVAERFESESRSLIKRSMSIVGPVIILFMAGIVALIVFSMLLAVFSINEIPI